MLVFVYLLVGCAVGLATVFAVGTLWILLVPNADQRMAKRYGKQFNLRKFMGM